MKMIKSKEFVLRPIKLSDANEYFECWKDNKTKKGFMSVPKTLGEVKKKIIQKIKESKGKKPTGETFAIEVGDKFAGWVGVDKLNQEFFEHRGNVFYGIHPKFRKKGIATKALKIVTRYAFKKYKLKRLEGWCRTFNKASARVMEKAGFKLEGVLRKNKCKDGKYLNDMVWAIVK